MTWPKKKKENKINAIVYKLDDTHLNKDLIKIYRYTNACKSGLRNLIVNFAN